MVLVNYRCTDCRQMRIQFDVTNQGDADLWLNNRDLDDDDMKCAICGSDMKTTLEYEYATIFVLDDQKIGLMLGRMAEKQTRFSYADEKLDFDNLHTQEEVEKIPLPNAMDKDECRDYLWDEEEEQFIEEIESKIEELEEKGFNFPDKNRERKDEEEVQE